MAIPIAIFYQGVAVNGYLVHMCLISSLLEKDALGSDEWNKHVLETYVLFSLKNPFLANFMEVYINLLEENALHRTSSEWLDIQVVLMLTRCPTVYKNTT